MDRSASWHTRTVGGRAGSDQVAASNPRPGEWKRRYVANVARLRSGDREQIAEVVTALTERDKRYGLSQGEGRMLSRAIELLGEKGRGGA